MKSVLISNERKIDFSKPQLLVGASGLVVMSTGEHSASNFRGLVINDPNGADSVGTLGEYSERWSKSNFSFFEGEIKLSND